MFTSDNITIGAVHKQTVLDTKPRGRPIGCRDNGDRRHYHHHHHLSLPDMTDTGGKPYSIFGCSVIAAVALSSKLTNTINGEYHTSYDASAEDIYLTKYSFPYI